MQQVLSWELYRKNIFNKIFKLCSFDFFENSKQFIPCWHLKIITDSMANLVLI
jgi:hypothetical protein